MGIRSFLTHQIVFKALGHDMFQSPHGDSFFSDLSIERITLDENGFKFQSPRGDSFFSDIYNIERGYTQIPMFQSPHGDSFFSNSAPPAASDALPSSYSRFNPLTGTRSFLTVESYFEARAGGE